MTHLLPTAHPRGARAALKPLFALGHSPQPCPNHSQLWDLFPSRRQFLQTAGAAGLLACSGLESLAWGEKPISSQPRPIPGGFQIEPGGEVFHNFAPGVFDPIDSDRSGITDFNGFVGYAIVDGTGTGFNTETGEARRLFFEVDLRFMQGVYVGRDGNKHFATFSVI